MLTDCLNKQKKLSEVVFQNLESEMKTAINLEKQNRIADIASEFGVSTNNLAVLRGKLTPAIPKMFRDIKVSGDSINNQMDVSKKFKLLAAAEVHSWAQKSLKNDRWAREKECTFGSPNYQSMHGHWEK